MKKYIFTESQMKNILDSIIQEQSQLNEQREMHDKIAAVQKFLNERLKLNLTTDGRTGPNSKTEAAIIKYQTIIGVYPTDGVWGDNTENKMPPADKKMFSKYWSDSIWSNIFDR